MTWCIMKSLVWITDYWALWMNDGQDDGNSSDTEHLISVHVSLSA